jgi:hypothetical protein
MNQNAGLIHFLFIKECPSILAEKNKLSPADVNYLSYGRQGGLNEKREMTLSTQGLKR